MFLKKGLNDKFGTIFSQIVLIDPLPDFDEVFAIVIRHERQLNTAGNQSSIEDDVPTRNLVATQISNTHKKSFGAKSKRPLCTFWGMLGHS